jgi:hypothetical protein
MSSDLTDQGLAEIAAAMASRYEQSYIGVGNGSTAFDITQTDLTGTSKERAQCTNVIVSGATLTFVAEYDYEYGNFAWGEMGVFLEPTTGPMIVRKVLAGIGTKSPSQQWVAEAVVTFAHGA